MILFQNDLYDFKMIFTEIKLLFHYYNTNMQEKYKIVYGPSRNRAHSVD